MATLLVAAGAAAGMFAAGLGIAGAETAGTPPAMPAAEADPAPEGGDEARSHHRRRGGRHIALEVAAAAIGVTPAELRTALRDGQSVATVARARGVEPRKVIDALVTELRARVDAKVAAGELTRAEADARLRDVEARVAARIERAGRASGRGHGPACEHGHAGGAAAPTATA